VVVEAAVVELPVEAMVEVRGTDLGSDDLLLLNHKRCDDGAFWESA
jgi:hypothetical protein